jgi:hypothetical protein
LRWERGKHWDRDVAVPTLFRRRRSASHCPGNRELRRDLLVGIAAGDEPQHVDLAHGHPSHGRPGSRVARANSIASSNPCTATPGFAYCGERMSTLTVPNNGLLARPPCWWKSRIASWRPSRNPRRTPSSSSRVPRAQVRPPWLPVVTVVGSRRLGPRRRCLRSRTTADYPYAVEEALRYRRPRAVLIDEAQHVFALASGRRLEDPACSTFA